MSRRTQIINGRFRVRNILIASYQIWSVVKLELPFHILKWRFSKERTKRVWMSLSVCSCGIVSWKSYTISIVEQRKLMISFELQKGDKVSGYIKCETITILNSKWSKQNPLSQLVFIFKVRDGKKRERKRSSGTSSNKPLVI